MADIKKCSQVLAQFLAFNAEIGNHFQNEIVSVIEARNASKRKRGKGRRQAAPPQKKIIVEKNTGPLPATLPSIAEEPDHLPSSSTSLRKTKRTAAKRATEITSLQLKQTLSEKLRNPGSIVTTKASEKVPEKEKIDLPPCVVVLNRVSTPEIEDFNSSKGVQCFILEQRNDSLIHTNGENTSVTAPQLDDCFKVPLKSPIRTSRSTISKSKVKEIEKCRQPKDEVEKKLIREEKDQNENQTNDDNLTQNEGDDTIPVPHDHQEPTVELDNSADLFKPTVEKTESCFKIPEKPVEIPKKTQEISTVDTNEFIAPAASRPKRTRTKNKRYCDEEYLSDSFQAKKVSTCNANTVPDINITDPSLNGNLNSTESSKRRGKKRKSESCEPEDSKRADQGKTKESNSGIKSSTSSANAHLDIGESCASHSGTANSSPLESLGPRSRTKTLAKATVSNLIRVESPNETEESSVQNPCKNTSTEVIAMPGTRTRTREMNKKANLFDQTKKVNPALQNLGSEVKSAGKENLNAQLLKMLSSTEKRVKVTPLAINNTIFSPSKGPNPFSSDKKVESGKKIEATKINKRGHAAWLKKQELIKAQMQTAKKKREEREQRQLAHKLALEKKEKEKLAKLEKEKEEKDKQIATIKKLKEEQLVQKKQMTENMLREAEERRIKEEEAKQARLRKQEEEKRRAAEERVKQAEEAKRLHEMRLAEEAKEKELSMKEAEKNKKLKIKKNVQNCDSYQLTPGKDELPPRKPKNENDYGLSDVDSGESTDEESKPKKIVPKWAAKTSRMTDAMVQSKIHPDLLSAFFPMSYDLSGIIENNVRCRQRASSAVWDTPD